MTKAGIEWKTEGRRNALCNLRPCRVGGAQDNKKMGGAKNYIDSRSLLELRLSIAH